MIKLNQDIQILRGFSILLVVIYHFNISNSQFQYFGNGFLGVDVFFVISGYLMVLTSEDKTIKEFYIARVKRIFPAYFLVLILTFFYSTIYIKPVEQDEVNNQIIFSSFFLSNFYYLVQNSYFDKSQFKPLLNLWSLAVEIQFYLLFPLLFNFIKKKKILIAFFFISLISCIITLTISEKASFFLLPLRIWEFLIGSFLALNSNILKNRNSFVGKEYLNFFIITIFLIIFFIPINTSYTENILLKHPGLSSILVCIFTALIIKQGIPKIVSDSFFGSLFNFFGKYSYSIYLVHFPIIVFFNYAPFSGTIIGFPEISGTANLINAILIVITIIVISYIVYHLAENKNIFFKNFFYVLLVTLICFSFSFLFLGKDKQDYVEKKISYAIKDKANYRCGTFFKIFNPYNNMCELTKLNTGKKSLLIGDSHADSIKITMKEIALKKGYQLYFYHSDQIFTSKKITPEKIIETINKEFIEKIIIHFSIGAYLEGRTDLKKFINLAIKEGYEIIIIAPTPDFEISIPKYIDMKNNLKTNELKNNKFFSNLRKEYTSTNIFWKYMSAINKENIKILEPTSVFCQNTQCLVTNNEGKLLYRDSNHLTITGSNFLKKLFENIY
jgi:peptidoglycan/LPS O-acetylase OafA/YrhL